MGITASDIELINMARHYKPNIKTVLELGSQNLYRPGDDQVKPPFASEYYKSLGIEYACIDMAGDNGAMTLDLSAPIHLVLKGPAIGPSEGAKPLEYSRYDLITDFGTSEHVVANSEMTAVAFHEGHINSVYPTAQPTPDNIARGYYECWANKHRLLKNGGIMISVNPKTGNWPEHGYTYINQEFYIKLADLMGYMIHWLNENEAMGNPNAVNIECLLMKTVDNDFCTFEEFQTLPQFPA